MRNIKRILCPVDFSETSAAALRSAQELARLLGGTLVVAHVFDDPYAIEGSGDQVSTLVSAYERTMTGKLSELLSTLDHSVPVESRTARGAPAETIATLAEQEACDLIVMGTHGRTGLRHMLLGSVTERVLRIANVPVLTLRAPR
jgi:universal stress protein A